MKNLSFSLLLSMIFIHSSYGMFSQPLRTAARASTRYMSHKHGHSDINNVRIAIAHLKGLSAERKHSNPDVQKAAEILLEIMPNFTHQVTTKKRRDEQLTQSTSSNTWTGC